MPATATTQTPYPTLGYLTRRQPPGTGPLPGTDLPHLDAEAAVAG